ncbi:MAG: TonB-dependent receptor [Gammaproteobacteria bacterium]|nr:TonB-dependent receptor [Gammaproteobacteria bacterium]
MKTSFFSRLVATATMVSVVSCLSVFASSTSSSISGRIESTENNPISGATITIQHVPSGTTAVATTNDNGLFFQSGLRVGGPYSIKVQSAAYKDVELSDVHFVAGAQTPLVLEMQSVDVEEVVVTASSIISSRDLNNGVGSVYTANDISNQPSVSRDALRTVLRDPLAQSEGTGNLSIAGINPRFNGLAIDGSLQQDDFGLSDNTYATNRSPINVDAIESVALVASEYSVEGSGYTGGLVNITTKSGGNDWHGSAFTYTKNDGLIGDEYDGDRSFNPGDFDEMEFGGTISGPIVEDEVFFFLSLDKFDSTRTVDFSNFDSNNGIQPGFFDALREVIIDTYGFDPGTRPQVAATPVTTERILGKLDWNLTDTQRLSLTYQQTEEGDSSSSSSQFGSAWIDFPIELTSVTAQLFSDMTDRLSTTVRFNVKDFARGQNCRAGPGVGHMELNNINGDDLGGTPLAGLLTDEVDLLAGCDRFRHANDYSDTRTQFFASGDYLLDRHIIKLGYEYEHFELFNLFVPASAGRFVFDGYEAIINREARIDYVNVPSNNAIDGAAQWEYSKSTLFMQDTWQLNDMLEVTYGARYERFSQSDRPAFSNEVFGLFRERTDYNLDGKQLFMPRLSFRVTGLDQWVISGGYGLFSGGDPKVWTSNVFQVPTTFARIRNATDVDISSVPQSLIDTVAASSGTPIDVVDSAFRVPADWKMSLRAEYDYVADNPLDGSVITIQYLGTQPKHGFGWRNLAHTELNETKPLGVAPDGRPIYADLDALDIPNLTQLTNFTGGHSHIVTLGWSKSWDNGIDLSMSYAMQDIETVVEGTSSRGISNWRNIQAIDRNNPAPRKSPYEVSSAFKTSFGYQRDFGGHSARIDLFANRRTGSRYTYVFDVYWRNPLFGRAGLGEGPYDNDPLYVPTSESDPLVVFASSVDVPGFFNYLEENNIGSGIQDPFAFDAGASTILDLRLQWELPPLPGLGFLGDGRAKVIFDIENVLNLLNSEWGVFHTGPRYRAANIIQADLVTRADVQANGIDGARALLGDAPRTTCVTADTCVYRFRDFDADNVSFSSASRSVYQMRFGIRFDF